jgi:hypothetical protein
MESFGGDNAKIVGYGVKVQIDESKFGNIISDIE